MRRVAHIWAMVGFFMLTASLIVEAKAAPQDTQPWERQSSEEKACTECAANIAEHFDLAICKDWKKTKQKNSDYWSQWYALFECLHRTCAGLGSVAPRQCLDKPCKGKCADLIESMNLLERLCLSDSIGQENPSYRLRPDQDPRIPTPTPTALPDGSLPSSRIR